MGHWTPFSEFIHPALPEPRIVRGGISGELVSQLVTSAIVLGGIFIAYLLWLAYPALTRKLRQSAPGAALAHFWQTGWGFDWLYDRLIVRPIIWTARLNKDDAFDLIYDFIAWLSGRLNGILSITQTGQVRWYAVAIALGAIVILALAVLL
jgi:NADH-quinone oxidoreductase subunit L